MPAIAPDVARRFLRRLIRAESPAFAALLTVATQIFVVALNVTTGVLTARLLGVEGRGIFAAVTLWPQFLAGLANLGVPAAAVYFLCKADSERSAVSAAGLLLAVGLGVLTTLAGCILLPALMTQYGPETIRLAIFCTLWTVPFLLTMMLRQILVAHGRFRAFNASSYLPPLLYLLALLGLYAVTPLTPALVSVCLMVPSLLVLAWLLHGLQLDWAAGRNGLFVSLRQLAAYAAKAAPSDVTTNLMMYLDRLVLVAMIQVEALGLYVVAFSLSRLMLVLQTVVTSVLFPVMAGRPAVAAKALHDFAFRLVLYAVLFSILSVWLLGHLVLVHVYGAEFGPAALLLDILVVEAGLTCIGQVLVQLFLSLNRPSYGSVAQVVSLAVAAVGLAVLVPELGAAGAAWSLLGAAVVRVGVLLAGVRWRLNMRLPRLYPNRADSIYLWGRLT